MYTVVVLYFPILSVVLHHGTQFVCAQCSGSPKKIDVGYKSQRMTFPESGEYDTNLTCQWLLSSTVSGAILFKSTDIEIDCPDSYNIYDGSNKFALAKQTGVCTTGSAISHSLDRSSGQDLFLELKSDGISNSGRDKGFTIYFVSSPDLSNCSVSGSVTTVYASNTSQAFTSPSFPSTYPSHHRCEWIIYPTITNAEVTLLLYYVDIDIYNGACYDKLTITYGPSQSQTDEVCGNVIFSPNKTYTNGGSGAITVTFTSDNTQEESGFVAVFVQSAESTTLETTESSTTTEATTITTEPSTTSEPTTVVTTTTNGPTPSTATLSPTTQTTTSATTPRPCFDQRNFTSNLLDHCGVYSAAAKCGPSNSACMTTVDDQDDWRCRCTRGFIQNDTKCDRVPLDLFAGQTDGSPFQIQLDESSPSDVLLLELPTDISATSIQSSYCNVTIPAIFYCQVSAGNVTVYIRTEPALTADDLYYRLLVYATVTVDYNDVSGSVVRTIQVNRPLKQYSAFVIDTAQPGQHVFYLPIKVDVALEVNSTFFSIDDKRTIYVEQELGSLRNPSTIFYSEVVKVSQKMAPNEDIAIVNVFVIRPEVTVPVRENVRIEVAYFEIHGSFDVMLLNQDDATEFFITPISISMTRPYNYDAMVDKTLTFVVRFNQSEKAFHHSNVKVMITDEDDEPPKFTDASTNVQITQSALQTFIMNLKATDKDTEVLTYFLQPETSDFFIKSRTELWKTTALNDSSVTVIVSDLRNQNDSMLVNVEVIQPISQDLNNNFSVTINEELDVGTRITTISDPDHENFQFLNDRARNYFHLDNHTGEVTLTKKIDRDTDTGLDNDRLSFSIRAAQKTFSCSFVNLGRLNVHINDINDVKPEFKGSSYTAVVVEDLNGASVEISPIVEVVDPDLHNLFTFTPKSHADVFEIQQNPGEKNFRIVTKRAIDRDDGVSEMFTLTISVSDGVNSTETDISVTVLDVNDNIPQYKNSTTRFSVPENTPIGTMIAFLLYEDMDKDENGTLDYRDDNGYFVVSDGVLTVDGPLDREVQSSHKLVLTVCDRSVDHKCTATTFDIDVTDLNDNGPEFVSPSEVTSVPEDHTCSTSNPILRASFTDPDVGVNSVLSYRVLSHNTTFGIDRLSGALYCIGKLEFDQVNTTFYDLDIEACDGGNPRKCSVHSVFIEITDVNDNDPVFLGEFKHGNYSTTVESNDFVAKSKPVALVSATDYDSGRNGDITFEFTSGSGVQFMRIDSNNGLISTKIDSSPGPIADNTYTLTVVVRDQGQPSRSSTTTLSYTVKADSAAFEFIDNDIHWNLRENELHENFYDLSKNITFHQNNVITLTFEIPSSSDDLKFEVNRATGMLSMKSTASLDREEKSEHLFPVRALGNGVSTLALVTIKVLDLNDNPPILTKPLQAVIKVYESETEGSVLLNVTATDADEAENAVTVYFLILGTAEADYCTFGYKINSTTGAIYLGAELDYDSRHNNDISTTCKFTIQAQDSLRSDLMDSSDVTIELLDVNDNPPTFVGSTSTIIMAESTTAADKIEWVGTHVTDLDMRGGPNSDVSVEITNADCPFDVTTRLVRDRERKIIFSPKDGISLDYENIKEYTCNLTAKDKGQPLPLSTQKTVYVRLTDVNDNKPEVTDGPYKTDLHRSAKVGSVVLSEINATDKDEGDNARLIFTKDIAGTPNSAWDFFSINTVNGEIQVSQSLFDFGYDEVVLSVNISDRGTPMLTTLFKVTINVSDENQPPYFGQGEVIEEVTLVEETRYSSSLPIHKFRTALDFVDKSSVTCDCDYYFLENNDKFVLREDTAQIFMKDNATLDREENAIVVLKIEGKDKGTPRKPTRPPLTVRITIRDINDNPPRFTQPSYETEIFQEHPLGETFFTVTAEDPDDTENAVTKYYVTDTSPSDAVKHNFNESVININETSGEMELNGSLLIDTETPFYDTFYIDVTVLAVDIASPDKYRDTAVVRVLVNYDDPNRYTPKFIQDNYQASLDLSSDDLNRLVLAVMAYDNDTNTKLTYGIANGNIRDTFRIHPESGNITQVYPIDDVVMKQLKGSLRMELTVVAVDDGVRPKTGSTMVTITLSGNAQPCGTGAQESTPEPPTTDDPAFRTAMFVLIGVVCFLLISNSYFIIKYCRKRPPPRRDDSRYTTETAIRKSKNHDYDRFSPTLDTSGKEDWTSNVAYHSNQQISRGFPESMVRGNRTDLTTFNAGEPPALPSRPDPHTTAEPPVDYDQDGYTSPSNEGLPRMHRDQQISLRGQENPAYRPDSDNSLFSSRI